MDNGKSTVYLVQQGVWEMPLESMPLAVGYLKAHALANPSIGRQMDITIHNFRGGATHAAMANSIFRRGAPDIIAFSVFGWSYRSFGALAATFKQLNPRGWAVFGGTHVTDQAERAFRMFPEVDVVVNGEGEVTFTELLEAYLGGATVDDLGGISGISFRGRDGAVVTTAPRDRIQDLNVIPSPALTGALDLTDATGRFRYDVALMETNRGCPYKCAFCYWGGATGQKVRAFALDRLRAELELFARLEVHTIVCCDANFGLLPGDLDFVRAFVEVRDRFGFPRALETSWAKNKSRTFYEIVKMMKDAGLRSSFTIALQTLSSEALQTMNRRNMKVNEWEDLAEWLTEQGFDCYAELIWGAPGETIGSFMQGYDKLARRMSRIAVYPILLLPNTDYMEKKEQYGIISTLGDHDDFEYVLAHNSMTFDENQRMQRFLFWARVVAENAVFRHIWIALRELAGLSQSQVLRNFGAWIETTDDAAAAPLASAVVSAAGGTASFGAAISYLYSDPAAKTLLGRWWAESIRPLLGPSVTPVLDEVFRFDVLTQPVFRDGTGPGEDLPVVTVRGEKYYVRRDVPLGYDVPGLLAALRAEREPDLRPSPARLDLYYRVGSESAVTSTNHEIVMHFMGMTLAEVLADAGVRDDPAGGTGH